MVYRLLTDEEKNVAAKVFDRCRFYIDRPRDAVVVLDCATICVLQFEPWTTVLFRFDGFESLGFSRQNLSRDSWNAELGITIALVRAIRNRKAGFVTRY